IIILVLLIALYFLVEHRESSMTAPKSVENFLGVDTSEVDKITIGRLGGATILTRASGNWYLMEGEEHRTADPNAAQQLIDILGDMKVGNVISDNPENQIKFQVDTLTGFTVSLYSGDNLLSAVVIGKMADYMHTYVRLRDESKVYIADGMMSQLFNRAPSDWRNKTIFDVPTTQVYSVAFKFGDEHYQIIRTDTVWSLSEPPFNETFNADQDSVRMLLSALCALKAGGFATAYDTTEYSFENIGYTATVTMLDGSTRLLEAAEAEEDANRHFVRIPEDNSVFIIFDSPWQKIAKNFHNLILIEKNS
ncbi:MAG: DUF4340 domain-containing protein, partial [candidate division Zixibacteria bacterium]|nr:DUF4340 domain-containing protein [candidate division Zixibacteria bacterium]